MVSILNFFDIEVIKITSDINRAEIRVDLGYFVINKLSFESKKCLKFYQFLISLSGGISLNSGPSQYLRENDSKFEPFHNPGLHFLYINVNSLLM